MFPFTYTVVENFGYFEVKFTEKMMRPFHLSKKRCSTHRCCNSEWRVALVTKFIAGLGYPNTIINDIKTKLFGAANELKAFMEAWDKDRLEVQSTWSSTLSWNLGKISSKLHENHDRNLGQPKLHGQSTCHKNMSCGPNSLRKTNYSSEWRPWRSHTTHD